MNPMNGRKVLIARFHQGFLIEKCGNITNPADKNTLKSKNMTMTKIEGGLTMSGVFQGKAYECFVPDSNIIALELEPEVKK